jgi:hypothetical protein
VESQEAMNLVRKTNNTYRWKFSMEWKGKQNGITWGEYDRTQKRRISSSFSFQVASIFVVLLAIVVVVIVLWLLLVVHLCFLQSVLLAAAVRVANCHPSWFRCRGLLVFETDAYVDDEEDDEAGRKEGKQI